MRLSVDHVQGNSFLRKGRASRYEDHDPRRKDVRTSPPLDGVPDKLNHSFMVQKGPQIGIHINQVKGLGKSMNHADLEHILRERKIQSQGDPM